MNQAPENIPSIPPHMLQEWQTLVDLLAQIAGVRAGLIMRLRMVSNLGHPIRLPDGRPFGTLCVLDDHKNGYAKEIPAVIKKLRNLLESHLQLLHENQRHRLLAEQSTLRRILDNLPVPVACLCLDLNPQLLYLSRQVLRAQHGLPGLTRPPESPLAPHAHFRAA